MTTTILPSGTSLTLTLPDDSPVRSINTSFKVAGPAGAARSYMVGSRGYFERACTEMVRSTTVSRTVFAELEMLMALGEDGLVTTVGLRGPYHDVITVFGGPLISLAAAEAAFIGFTFADGPGGLRMQPTASSGIVILAEDATVAVTNRGIVVASADGHARSAVPPWAGTKTPFGEVWSTTQDGRLEYLAAYRNAAARIIPFFDVDLKRSSFKDWIVGLDLEATAQ